VNDFKERKKVSNKKKNSFIDRSVECIKKQEIKKYHSILLVAGNFENALKII
jgi:hypothetical protein